MTEDNSKRPPHGVHMSDAEMKQVIGAETAAFESPVPTQVISNGEFNPLPQTPKQKQVEALIKEYGDTYGEKQGLDRRSFLRSTSGMAAAFLAMNKVFGPVWSVDDAEAKDSEAADERAEKYRNQFIFDDQTHFVRDDFDKEGLLDLGHYAAKHWNPSILDDIPMELGRYKLQNFLKEIFLDSDTKVALVTSAPFDEPDWWLLFNDQIAAARDAMNDVVGSRRLLAHSVFTPGQDGWLEEVDRCIEHCKPESWKGYTVGNPLAATAKGTSWRLDDEEVVYPFYERVVKAGGGRATVCIHKGLLPADYEKTWPEVWKTATVRDLPKAAKDWPQINFVIYHSALRAWLEDPAPLLAQFESTGYVPWSTDLARMPEEHGLTNVYADLGTVFANAAVSNPRFAAAFIGQLVNEMGSDRVVWGTDCVWYGSPQWQIEAMRRLEIPDDLMEKMGWETKLGAPDGEVKNKIFGLNSAKLYKYDMLEEYPQISDDQLVKIKSEYDRENVKRNNAFYGYVPKPK